MDKTVYYEDICATEELPPLVTAPISRVQLVKYAGAAGDFNPLHFIDEVGQRAGTGGVIAQGMLIMGFAGRAVARWVPNRNLKRFSVRFVGMARPGEAITICGKIVKKYAAGDKGTIVGEIVAANQNGDVKLKGSFEATLPLKGKRR